MNIKKFISNLAVVVAVIGIGGATVAMTSAQTIEDAPSAEVQQEEGERGTRGNRGNQEKPEWYDEALAASTFASELGTTVDAVEAAQESDTPLTDALGVTREEIQAAKTVAKQAVIDQAVANGDITAEEAEALSNRQGNRGGRSNGNQEKPEWYDEALAASTFASELGTTVEAVEAAQESDTSLTDALGVTREEIQAAKTVAKQAVIDQAVANGDITAEEAEALSNRQGRGNGARGQRGGNAVEAETNA